MWEGYKNWSVFEYSQLEDFYRAAIETKEVNLVAVKKTKYFNIPCAFDIETTSWTDGTYPNGSPVHLATMYIWQFGLNGQVIYGRTWEQFETLLKFLHIKLGSLSTYTTWRMSFSSFVGVLFSTGIRYLQLSVVALFMQHARGLNSGARCFFPTTALRMLARNV